MLTTLLTPRHTHIHRGALQRLVLLRYQSNGKPEKSRADGALSKTRLGNAPSTVKSKEDKDTRKTSWGSNKPSLFEQLFPDQRRAPASGKDAEQDVPYIAPTAWTPNPLDPAKPEATIRRYDVLDTPSPAATLALKTMQEHERRAGVERSVLVLRNASKNLLGEDFQRVVPRGEHLPSWQTDPGGLVKVIPGRNIQTLAQENYYYLIFSSAMSAFRYQGFVTRLHRLVAQHTPHTMLSPILPPPGYTVNGIDANEAIEIFTLVPPNHGLDLRQLKPPLTPLMDAIVRHEGYPEIVNRPERSPFEARLTMEGPQLTAGSLGHIFRLSGKHRGLSWSGGKETAPRITQWRGDATFAAPSPMSYAAVAEKWGHRERRGDLSKTEVLERSEMYQPPSGDLNAGDLETRITQKIFVIGFHTDRALKSFVHYWHKRPLTIEGFEHKEDDDELPPVAHVEILW